MATPATQQADKLKTLARENMDNQLAGPLETMKNLEDKFGAVKSLHSKTYPPIQAAKKGLDFMAMKDSPSGDPAGGVSALATIGSNEVLVKALKRLSDEYSKIKLKVMLPTEFAKTKLTGELDYVNEDFDTDGYLGGVTDDIYDITPDLDIIDESDRLMREAGDKFDYTVPGL
jgi:hypothetical protein